MVQFELNTQNTCKHARHGGVSQNSSNGEADRWLPWLTGQAFQFNG